MGIRKRGIVLTRSLLSFFIFSLIFTSLVDLNIKSTMENLFGDIYHFSDEETKNDTLNNLDLICRTTAKGEGQDSLVRLKEICSDKEVLRQVKENCNSYYELRKEGQVEVMKDLEKSCSDLLLGDMDARCDEINKQPDVNLTNIGNMCQDYNEGDIEDKRLFTGIMMTAIELPEMDKFESKGFAVKISIIVLALMFLLFILYKEHISELLFSLGKIFINLGIVLIIIFSLFYLYNAFFPPDTTFILKAFSTSPDSGIIKKALPVLVPLILGKVFDIRFLWVGMALLFSGVFLKIIFKKHIKYLN